MTRTAIIHVGLEKTGSTSIQAWLNSARPDLLNAGILVPTSIGAPNHTKIVAACLDDGVVDDIKAHLLARNDWTEAILQQQVRAAFDAELTRTPGWSKLVISSELISSRLHTAAEMSRLTEWVGRHVDRLQFVIYLRRQDDLAVSRYSTALRVGHAGFDDIWSDLSGNSFLVRPQDRVVADDIEYFNHQRILDRFTRIAEADLAVRSYAPPDGQIDVVADFCSILGLDPGSASTATQRANSALSAAAQYVVSELNKENRVWFPNGVLNRPYRALLKQVEAELTGQPRLVSRPEAEAFLARFATSNAAVEQQWFPDGMFRKGLSHWPDTIDYSHLASELRPVLSRYREIAATLPKHPPKRTLTQRLMSSLLRRSHQ